MSETGTLVKEDFGLLYKKFLILIFVVLLTRLKNIETLRACTYLVLIEYH